MIAAIGWAPQRRSIKCNGAILAAERARVSFFNSSLRALDLHAQRVYLPNAKRATRSFISMSSVCARARKTNFAHATGSPGCARAANLIELFGGRRCSCR